MATIYHLEVIPSLMNHLIQPLKTLTIPLKIILHLSLLISISVNSRVQEDILIMPLSSRLHRQPKIMPMMTCPGTQLVTCMQLLIEFNKVITHGRQPHFTIKALYLTTHPSG